MGFNTISININNMDLKQAYNKVFSGDYKIIEANSEKYFYRIPSFNEVLDIEIGTDINRNFIKLKNGEYVAIEKKEIINIKEIRGY